MADRPSFPRLFFDDEDTLVDDERHEVTLVYGLTASRRPAVPEQYRWMITVGCLNGAPTDIIAFSIAAGERWMIGPARSAPRAAVWLCNVNTPISAQIAAWPIPDQR